MRCRKAGSTMFLVKASIVNRTTALYIITLILLAHVLEISEINVIRIAGISQSVKLMNRHLIYRALFSIVIKRIDWI